MASPAHFVRWAAEALLDLVYPRPCAGCGEQALEGEGHLCWECRRRLSFVERPFCGRCGDPVDGVVDREYLCSLCSRKLPAFDLARSAVRHRGPFRRALHGFKYGHATFLATDLAVLVTACVKNEYHGRPLDAVTAVPLYHTRLRERSYNQAALLAAQVSRMLGLPFMPRCLERAQDTGTQTHLTASERRENVKRAFRARNESWIKGRNWLLVDDVMTTGATVDACSRVLSAAGAAGVYVVTAARG